MGLAGATDDFVGVCLGEFELLVVASNGFLEVGGALARHVADDIASILPGLMVVIVPRTHRAEFSPFHPLKSGDLFQNGFRFGLGFHGR